METKQVLKPLKKYICVEVPPWLKEGTLVLGKLYDCYDEDAFSIKTKDSKGKFTWYSKLLFTIFDKNSTIVQKPKFKVVPYYAGKVSVSTKAAKKLVADSLGLTVSQVILVI